MTDKERREIKDALLQCAKENENRNYPTFHIVVSSICRSAKERIEEFEQQVEKMKCCNNCKHYLKALEMEVLDLDKDELREPCNVCEDYNKWELRIRIK